MLNIAANIISIPYLFPASNGGSHGGEGGLGANRTASEIVFDSFQEPTMFGQGSHTAGGGVLKIEATTVTVNGRISAK